MRGPPRLMVVTCTEACQPRNIRASARYNVGNLAADKSCDPTSRNVGAKDAMPRASALNAHLKEMET
jgi:hypothetical protein